MKSFAGKSVLLTGANLGIGRALVEEALRRRAKRVYAGARQSVSVAQGIFDGVDEGEDDIFPDPMSQLIARGWRSGATKALERRYAELLVEAARATAR